MNVLKIVGSKSSTGIIAHYFDADALSSIKIDTITLW